MAKNKNVSRETIRKPQSEISKRIKRINQNLKALGVKYGTDSTIYERAVNEIQDIFKDQTKMTKSGFMSIKNTKEVQKDKVKLAQAEKNYKLSLSGLKKQAITVLKKQGIEKPTKAQIEERISLDEQFEWVVNNTDEWYKLTTLNADIRKAKRLLKLKGQRKIYDDMDWITEQVLKVYHEEQEKKQRVKQETESGVFSNGFKLQGNDNNIFSS